MEEKFISQISVPGADGEIVTYNIKLGKDQRISLTGDVDSDGVYFNGSEDAVLDIKVKDYSHHHSIANIDNLIPIVEDAQALRQEFDGFMYGIDNKDEVIETLVEIQNYISDDKDAAAILIGRVEDLETNKMNKKSPVGTGSLSLNRKADTTVGQYSVAIGDETTASAYASYAEGNETISSSNAAHAEGNGTTASGQASHAEGEGTIASSSAAHAEGNGTTASGMYSHSEGVGTTASGKASHSEGFYTKASSENQHVQGKYNIEDTTGTYAHIVGNGRGSNALSNAHTLDWDGNAWYKGTIKIGGASYANASEVATITYINDKVPNTTNADNGKFLRVVNGAPAWTTVPSAEEASF